MTARRLSSRSMSPPRHSAWMMPLLNISMCMSWYLSSRRRTPRATCRTSAGSARRPPWPARHPLADDGVHRVVGAAAVDADPAQLLPLGPLGELAVRAGVLDHVADLVGGRLVPAVVVVARVDDEDVALLHLDALLDHLRGVDVVVAGASDRSTMAPSCMRKSMSRRRCPCPACRSGSRRRGGCRRGWSA